MRVREYLSLGMFLALTGDMASAIWWSTTNGDWSGQDLLRYALMLGVAGLVSFAAIWSVEPAVRAGLLARAGVIGLHIGALAAVFFVTYVSLAIPPMLVMFISLGIAFGRFVRVPLPE